MNNSLKICIVTPSFNQGQFIEETIKSVLSQGGDFYIDYIVMDGGSTDNSVEIIKKYEQLIKEGKWPIRCKGIKYRWFSEKDNGQVDAINKGFSIAKGSILGWINSDDVYYPSAFKKVLSKDWNKIDFCYGKGMWISKDGKDLCLYPTFKPNKYSLYFQCTLCQPTVFLKKEVYEQLGNFSMEFFYVFDYEYWIRAVFNSKVFSFIPSLIAKSRMYAQNKSLAGQQTVIREVSKLKQKYYWNQKLNKVFTVINRFMVNSFTEKKLEILFIKIAELESDK